MASWKQAATQNINRDTLGRFYSKNQRERSGTSSASGDNTSLEMESITMIEACLMCHGFIKNGHKCESSFTHMKIVIDSTESNDGTKQTAPSGFGTKHVAASGSGNRHVAVSGFGTKRHQATAACGSGTRRATVSGFSTKWHQAKAASGSDAKLDTTKEMMHSVIEKMHVLEEKIDAPIEKRLK
ncbi:hypothetical protein GUJ93_ZPchr0015g6649 [Zizania palustris]|uniref:Uncharacterized protein n=1 Tax=Zizania palustris TaxID=103762 RepID=A0A8J5TD25_ZIZPA|nr:hypothetical protein GUJ93_ZPchr0015g6649 [Zizania palustris]